MNTEPPSESLVTPSDLKLLRDQIDQLQLATAEKKQPWYRQRPSLMSLLALVFSAYTFVVTQQRADLQEIRSKKEELRKVLGELISFQESNLALITTVTNPQQREAVSSLLNAKRGISLQTAEALADELRGKVSSSEYGTLAREKSFTSDFNKAEMYFLEATIAARDNNPKATALRDVGVFYFQPTRLRDLGKARDYFGKSIEVSTAGEDDYSIYTTGYTYEAWGLWELQNGLLSEGKAKLQNAREYYTKIKPPNMLGQWALESLEKRTPR